MGPTRTYFFKLFVLFLALSLARWYFAFPLSAGKPLHWAALSCLVLTAIPWPGFPLHWLWQKFVAATDQAGRFFAGSGLVLLLAAAYQHVYHQSPGALALVSSALFLFAISLTGLSDSLFSAWMKLAHGIQFVVSRVLLTLIYAIAVIPVGLIARLAGKRFLEKDLDPARESYWINRGSAKRIESYGRHF